MQTMKLSTDAATFND